MFLWFLFPAKKIAWQHLVWTIRSSGCAAWAALPLLSFPLLRSFSLSNPLNCQQMTSKPFFFEMFQKEIRKYMLKKCHFHFQCCLIKSLRVRIWNLSCDLEPHFISRRFMSVISSQRESIHPWKPCRFSRRFSYLWSKSTKHCPSQQTTAICLEEPSKTTSKSHKRVGSILIFVSHFGSYRPCQSKKRSQWAPALPSSF